MTAKMFDRITILLTISSILLLLSSNYINSRTKKPILKSKQKYITHTINQDFLNAFSFGHQRMVSSYLWISTLLQSDLRHHRGASKDNWMYVRFKTIAKLDPRFYQNYKYGGLYLSVIKDDISGSVDILERGLEHYGDDFWLNYYLGFNHLYELGDTDNALIYFDKVISDPLAKRFSPLLPSIIAKLKAQKSDPKVAFAFLLPAYRSLPEDSPLKKHFAKTLYTLKAKMDLDCLNKNSFGCQRRDFYGESYIRGTDGRYKSKHELSPIKLKIKKRKN